MGSGVVGSLSVKSFGLEDKAQGEEASTFQKVKSAYIADVKEAEKEGQFVADQVISGAKNVAGKAQDQVTKVIDKGSELGTQALEGAESAVNSTIDFVKSLWG